MAGYIGAARTAVAYIGVTWIGDTPHKDLGMTKEKYALLQELASDSEYWATCLAIIDSTAHLKLTTVSNHIRRRLSSIVLELDEPLYLKSWMLPIPRRLMLAPKKPVNSGVMVRTSHTSRDRDTEDEVTIDAETVKSISSMRDKLRKARANST